MRRTLGMVGLALLLGVVTPSAQTADVYSEDAVKAAFLVRFAGYIDWPAQALQGPQFTIAVLGNDAVADKLEAIVHGRTIKERPVEVRRLARPQQLGGVQLLYVGAGHSADVRRLAAEPVNRSVLLVTETTEGLDLGSAVNFLLLDHRVRFEISLAAAERAGLKIPAELLSVAIRVQGGRLRSDASCWARHAGHCSESGLWASAR